VPTIQVLRVWLSNPAVREDGPNITAEASGLKLAPGVCPAEVELVNEGGTFMRFVNPRRFFAHQEFVGWRYHYAGPGVYSFTIFND
jgi:hypothetical protein